MGEQPCVQPPQGRPGKGRGQPGRDQYQLRHQLSVQPTCAVSPVPGMAGYTASTRAQCKCLTHKHRHTQLGVPALLLASGVGTRAAHSWEQMPCCPILRLPFLKDLGCPLPQVLGEDSPPDTGHLHRTPWGPLPAQLPSGPLLHPCTRGLPPLPSPPHQFSGFEHEHPNQTSGLKSQLCCFRAVYPWKRCFASLGFSLIYKVRITAASMS